MRLSRDVEDYVAALEEAGSRPRVGDSDLTVAKRFEEVRRLIESGEYGDDTSTGSALG